MKNRYKVAIFHSQGFEEFQSPSFWGEDCCLAICVDAKTEEPLAIATRVLSPKERKAPGLLNEKAKAAVEELSLKISPHEWYTLFTDDSTLSKVSACGRKGFVIPTRSAPRELVTARNFALKYFSKRRELLTLEHPLFADGTADASKFQGLLKNKLALEQFDLEDELLAPIWREATRKQKMLVHICCGPDAAGVIQQLKKDFELLCFWYDPNIQPQAEHDKRLEAFIKVAEEEKVDYVVGEYDVDRFLENIKGLEDSPEQGAKCSKCYDMRIERAAVEAKARNCDQFTTSLAISPHKVQEKLKNFGGLYGGKYGVPYYARNFMKDEGFKSSVEYSKDYDIFRQDYCGCWFSLHEGGTRAQSQAKEWGLTKQDLKEGTWTLPE